MSKLVVEPLVECLTWGSRHARADRWRRDRRADAGLLAATLRAPAHAGRMGARAAPGWLPAGLLGGGFRRCRADGHRPRAAPPRVSPPRGQGGRSRRAAYRLLRAVGVRRVGR